MYTHGKNSEKTLLGDNKPGLEPVIQFCKIEDDYKSEKEDNITTILVMFDPTGTLSKLNIANK